MLGSANRSDKSELEPPTACDTRIIVLTGQSESGKTTVCAKLIAMAREKGADAGGVLTLPRYVGGRTVGLDVQDVAEGHVRPLAETVGVTHGPSIGRFRFHAEGIRWGSEILLRTQDCDLLIVDELGPLELLEGDGWHVALDVLRTGTYGLALVVVRPVLVARFGEKLVSIGRGESGGLGKPPYITVTLNNRDDLPGQIAALWASRQKDDASGSDLERLDRHAVSGRELVGG